MPGHGLQSRVSQQMEQIVTGMSNSAGGVVICLYGSASMSVSPVLLLRIGFHRALCYTFFMGQPLTIDLPDDLLQVLGTADEARQEAKTALVLDLVRRGKVSRARAAEFLQISLWDFPALLAQYQIPWFDYSSEALREDLKTPLPPRSSK